MNCSLLESGQLSMQVEMAAAAAAAASAVAAAAAANVAVATVAATTVASGGIALQKNDEMGVAMSIPIAKTNSDGPTITDITSNHDDAVPLTVGRHTSGTSVTALAPPVASPVAARPAVPLPAHV